MRGGTAASDGPHGQLPASGEHGSSVEFPWHLGVCDAHCHPTDTMTSIATVSSMQARFLTIMATRLQDQELVSDVASTHGVRDGQGLEEGKIIPSFGWHPWFSHMLYDDTASDAQALSEAQAEDKVLKRQHYLSVLSPSTPSDDFLDALPKPLSLRTFIDETRQRLVECPRALIGEVGLDKSFRLPDIAANPPDGDGAEEGLTPGGREGRPLTSFHVKMAHQISILKAQLSLAAELGRAVSVHGVGAHGVLYETLASTWKGYEVEVLSKRQRKQVAPNAEDFWSSDDELNSDEEDGGVGTGATASGTSKSTQKARGVAKTKPYPARICLHSFSGPAPVLRQYLHPAIPAHIFFSFSTAVNLSTAGGEGRFAEVVTACPDDRILAESDLHIAGPRMDAALEDMYRRICTIKGWTLEDGVSRIRRNYEAFAFG